MSSPIADYLVKALDATLDVARAFPEEKYDFWPTPQSMTVVEQITHLADDLEYVIKPIADRMGLRPPPGEAPGGPISQLGRMTVHVGQVLAQLDGDDWTQIVEYPDGFTMTPERAALVMLEHDAHHRGQLIVALRLLGIDPPKRWKES